jgi:hypothetical protein
MVCEPHGQGDSLASRYLEQMFGESCSWLGTQDDAGRCVLVIGDVAKNFKGCCADRAQVSVFECPWLHVHFGHGI